MSGNHKGPVLVFTHRQLVGGKCIKKGQEHDLHKRLLPIDYLIDTLGAKSRVVYSCKNRENARHMEDYLQKKLLPRDLGTQRLFRAIDRANRDYKEGDEHKTFKVLITTLNAEKVQEELDNGFLEINR